jgi:hypothetical protein
MKLKFISPAIHGVIDWLTVPALVATPRACGFSRRVTRLYDGVAGGVAASSAFTDYPAGVVKLMPMQAHLMLDKLNGGLFLAAAALMDEPDNARTWMAATGLFLLMNGICTRSRPDEEAPHQGSFAREHPVQRYAHERRPDVYSQSSETARMVR